MSTNQGRAPPLPFHLQQQQQQQHSNNINMNNSNTNINSNSPATYSPSPIHHSLNSPSSVHPGGVSTENSPSFLYSGETPSNTNSPTSPHIGGNSNSNPSPANGSSGSGSDFIRKLTKMLNEKQYEHIVSWSENGDSFVIKDQNEFSKQILPALFKHNNFASFVRQLNKYDFHKVKQTDKSKMQNDQLWEFKHPNFNRHGLEFSTIKRKITLNKRVKEEGEKNFDDIQSQLDNVENIQQDMANYMQALSRNYEVVVRELVDLKKNMVAQDQLIQTLLQYLVNKESSDDKERKILPEVIQNNINNSNNNALESFTPTPSSPNQIFVQNFPTSQNPQNPQNSLPDPSRDFVHYQNFNQVDELSAQRKFREPSIHQSNSDVKLNNDLSTTLSNGILKPKPIQNIPSDQQSLHHSSQPNVINNNNSSPFPKSSESNETKKNLRRTGSKGLPPAFAPSWATPPKVLLVEDDKTCQQYAARILQVFGCSYEIAQNGLEAVNKMNSQKYDLVLMDISMPKMDGISATSKIRQFDLQTPVISWTSDVNFDQQQNYFNNGMTDILPKPFSHHSLIAMVEQYCSHLKLPPPNPSNPTMQPTPKISNLNGLPNIPNIQNLPMNNSNITNLPNISNMPNITNGYDGTNPMGDFNTPTEDQDRYSKRQKF